MTQLIQLLKNELSKRQLKNSRYSLRAFAQFLEMSPAQLSQILSGKKPLSANVAIQIVKKIVPTKAEQSFHLAALLNMLDGPQFEIIEEASFHMISNWYFFAILSLGEIKNNSSEPMWIAERLGIEIETAKEAFRLLVELKLVSVKSDGGFTQSGAQITTTNDKSCEAIRNHHRQILDRAQHALEHVPMEYRDFSALTLASNPTAIARAKPLIEQFRRDLVDLLEGEQPTEVYSLSIALFPQTTSLEERLST